MSLSEPAPALRQLLHLRRARNLEELFARIELLTDDEVPVFLLSIVKALSSDIDNPQWKHYCEMGWRLAVKERDQ